MNAWREALVSPPVLALFNSTAQMSLDTDVCDKQCNAVACCVLLQKQEDETTLPIGYWSRTFSDSEKKFDFTERECLAIVQFVLILHSYEEETRF